jgi:hypothetical protein
LAFPTYLLGLERRTLDLRGVPLFSVPPVSKLPARIPLSFAAPSKTRTGSCGSSDLPSHRSARRLPDVAAHPSELPLLWFSKERPSTDINNLRPVPISTSRKRDDLRRCAAKRNTPSILVVPPDYDGLLRMLPCRFVAPCYRSWGSSCFQRGLPFAVFPRRLVLHAFPRLAPHTLRSFSLRSSRTVSPQSFPSRRCSFLLFPALRPSTSRLCSTPESVAARRCCHRLAARYSRGLCSPSRFSPHHQMLFRKAPEPSRRSGVALDHARRSGRALDVLAPRCMPDKPEACPSQRLYSRSCLPRRS